MQNLSEPKHDKKQTCLALVQKQLKVAFNIETTHRVVY